MLPNNGEITFLPRDIVIKKIIRACNETSFTRLMKLGCMIPTSVLNVKNAKIHGYDDDILNVIDFFLLCLRQQPHRVLMRSILADTAEVCEYFYKNMQTLHEEIVNKSNDLTPEQICYLLDLLMYYCIDSCTINSKIFYVSLCQYVSTFDTVSMYIRSNSIFSQRMNKMSSFLMLLEKDDLLAYFLNFFSESKKSYLYTDFLIYYMENHKDYQQKYFDLFLSNINPECDNHKIIISCVKYGHLDNFLKCFNYGLVLSNANRRNSLHIVYSCIWWNRKDMLEISLDYFNFDEVELYEILDYVTIKLGKSEAQFVSDIVTLLQKSGLRVCQHRCWYTFIQHIAMNDHLLRYKHIIPDMKLSVQQIYTICRLYVECWRPGIPIDYDGVNDMLSFFVSYGLNLSHDDFLIPRILLSWNISESRRILLGFDIDVDSLLMRNDFFTM